MERVREKEGTPNKRFRFYLLFPSSLSLCKGYENRGTLHEQQRRKENENENENERGKREKKGRTKERRRLPFQEGRNGERERER
jgi:hypothetical protein